MLYSVGDLTGLNGGLTMGGYWLSNSFVTRFVTQSTDESQIRNPFTVDLRKTFMWSCRRLDKDEAAQSKQLTWRRTTEAYTEQSSHSSSMMPTNITTELLDLLLITKDHWTFMSRLQYYNLECKKRTIRRSLGSFPA